MHPHRQSYCEEGNVGGRKVRDETLVGGAEGCATVDNYHGRGRRGLVAGLEQGGGGPRGAVGRFRKGKGQGVLGRKWKK